MGKSFNLKDHSNFICQAKITTGVSFILYSQGSGGEKFKMNDFFQVDFFILPEIGQQKKWFVKHIQFDSER